MFILLLSVHDGLAHRADDCGGKASRAESTGALDFPRPQRLLLLTPDEFRDPVSIAGPMYGPGGAIMLLEARNRRSTHDIDAAVLWETPALRKAVGEIAAREGLSSDWLNDGTNGFLTSSLCVPTPNYFRTQCYRS